VGYLIPSLFRYRRVRHTDQGHFVHTGDQAQPNHPEEPWVISNLAPRWGRRLCLTISSLIQTSTRIGSVASGSTSIRYDFEIFHYVSLPGFRPDRMVVWKDWCRLTMPLLNLQPGRKHRRREARLAKAAAVAPRPVDRLRPVVRCPTIKYNSRVRPGRGFTLSELKVQLSPEESHFFGSHFPKRRNSKKHVHKDLLQRERLLNMVFEICRKLAFPANSLVQSVLPLTTAAWTLPPNPSPPTSNA